jgi:hypothetical protein
MNPTTGYIRLTDVPLWNGATDTSTWTAWVDTGGTQRVDIRTSTEAQLNVGSSFVLSSKKEASEWDS